MYNDKSEECKGCIHYEEFVENHPCRECLRINEPYDYYEKEDK